MKKTLLSIALTTLALGVQAGTMGPIGSAEYFVPFVEGEATVTWNTTKSVTIFGAPASLDKDLWGGRGAVGVTHSYPSNWGYSAELGWGYYGHTNSFGSGTGPAGSLVIINSSYLYGFDMLAGLSYSFDPIQIFFKAGAMAENRHITGSAVLTSVVGGVTKTTTADLKTVATNVLPELKVGGLYAFNEHISFSLAYMHVFGNDNFAANVSGGAVNPNATAGINSVVSAQNPSLDSILFGLVYQFV